MQMMATKIQRKNRSISICIDGLDNHLLCSMRCHLNDMHISEVPKFWAEKPSMTTHATDLTDPFNTAHLLIIPL